jgi:hydroxyacylglutathione hydrolase
MKINKFSDNSFRTNSYLLFKGKNALLIDPTFESRIKILHFLKDNGLNLESILITHSHFDHISGVAKLKKECQSKIYIHKLDSQNLINPGSDGILLCEKVEKTNPDVFVEDQDKIYLDNIEIIVIHTPGHSPGSVCYFFPKEKVLFSGDTLFQGTCGTVSLPTSNKEQMKESLEKLSKLPKDTIVYPGHGRETSIKEEKWLHNLEKFLNF